MSVWAILTVLLACTSSFRQFGKVLLMLKNGINRYVSKYNTGDHPRAVFFQLTLGLYDALITLKSGLASCSRWYGSETLDGADWLLALNTAWIGHILDVLSHISTSVELRNEAIERCVNCQQLYSIAN